MLIFHTFFEILFLLCYLLFALLLDHFACLIGVPHCVIFCLFFFFFFCIYSLLLIRTKHDVSCQTLMYFYLLNSVLVFIFRVILKFNYPRSLIRAFAARYLDSMICVLAVRNFKTLVKLGIYMHVCVCVYGNVKIQR